MEININTVSRSHADVLVLKMIMLEKEIEELYQFQIKGLSLDEKRILFDEFCEISQSLKKIKEKISA